MKFFPDLENGANFEFNSFSSSFGRALQEIQRTLEFLLIHYSIQIKMAENM
jgi:hypothetical protein